MMGRGSSSGPARRWLRASLVGAGFAVGVAPCRSASPAGPAPPHEDVPARAAGGPSVADTLPVLSRVAYDRPIWTVTEQGGLRAADTAWTADSLVLRVPENRADPGARTIEIPVLRIPAAGSREGLPVFWLGGGPGQSNLRTARFDYLAGRHDQVMVGYRGVDGSVSLDCPEVSDVLRGGGDVLGEEVLGAVQDAFGACRRRLDAEGVDVEGYDVVEVIDDLEAARRGLGYGPVHVVAESFGTRLAWLWMQRYPESLARVVMVGANPPGGMVWDGRDTERVLERYAELWAADPQARARTPDLLAAMRAVDEVMPRRWLFLPIHPGNVRTTSFALLFERSDAVRVFDAWVAAFHGDPSGLWLMSLAARFVFPEIVNWGENAAKAMSVDWDRGRDLRDVLLPDDAVLGAPLGWFLWAPARSGDWTMEPVDRRYRSPAPSDVETLVISGGLDLTTPPSNAERDLLPYLSRGHHVVLENRGHVGDLWGLNPEGTRRLVVSFVEEGTVDTSAVERVPMDFSVSRGFPLLAKAAVGGVVLAVALLALGGWGAWRWMRRRRVRAA